MTWERTVVVRYQTMSYDDTMTTLLKYLIIIEVFLIVLNLNLGG